MYSAFDFAGLQCRHTKAAMNNLPTYRPDGLTPAEVQAIIDSAYGVRTSFESAESAYNLAHGALGDAQTAGHCAAIQVYGIMKSRYRKMPGTLEAINKLPVDDKTIGDTLERMRDLSSLWGALPNPPGSTTAFKAWDTMGKTEFDALLASLDTKFKGLPALKQAYETAQGNLHKAQHDLEDFAIAAIGQGMDQFRNSPYELEIINSIPSGPAAQDPGQAVITVTTGASGEVIIAVEALHGTTYTYLEQGPTATDFSVVAADRVEKTLTLTGRAPGQYSYKVIAHNSRGDGPESEVTGIVLES